MKKFTILSPLVLLATTALAQDSTCILQPSCSQLGYTSAEADCGSQKVLRCPFDVSQVACVGGGSNSGGGAGGDDYNPYDPKNELGDVIAFVIDKTATGNIDFTYGGGNIIVDCGNGTIVGGSASSSGTVSCSYPELGKYTIKLSGSFTYYGGASGSPTTLLKLDKSGITKMTKVCGSRTNGVIPPLPSTLKDATNMFKDCTNISSPYPKLPDELEIADYMFGYSASVTSNTVSMNFSGDIKLPSSLKSAKYMFRLNKKLNAVTGLENTKITNGSSMFAYSGITLLPGLPETLTNGHHMFYDCSNMTGTLTILPSSLVNGYQMFMSCDNITGSPEKPAGFTGAFCGNDGIVDGCYGGIFAGSGVQVDWD